MRIRSRSEYSAAARASAPSAAKRNDSSGAAAAERNDCSRAAAAEKDTEKGSPDPDSGERAAASQEGRAAIAVDGGSVSKHPVEGSTDRPYSVSKRPVEGFIGRPYATREQRYEAASAEALWPCSAYRRRRGHQLPAFPSGTH